MGDGGTDGRDPTTTDPTTSRAAHLPKAASIEGPLPEITVPRRIVLFADGTGNAHGGEPSNIWRLYQALDLSVPDQIAYYIPGVGTQSLKPLRLLDALTGFGVPSNVRKLYRFLSWNWRPGDEIWMFGFSRGAFTIRTLIGMIASQGLTPPVIRAQKAAPVAEPGRAPSQRRWIAVEEDLALDHVGMQRLARDAWRRYRAARTDPPWWSPIRPARLLRDVAQTIWSRLRGHSDDGHFVRARAVASQGQNRVGGEPVIRFVGLFDTVAAYGVPIEEFRKAIDRTIFPLVFKDGAMSPLVRHARHALSLDDERTTFHPVRIEHMSPEKREAAREAGRIPERCEDVEEVWFAGAHSDVGGGYPDDALAQVALDWMIDRIDAAPGTTGALRLDPGIDDAVAAALSPFGPRHDPRSGLGVFYRYAPRTISEPAAKTAATTDAPGSVGPKKKPKKPREYGGSPVIHESVVRRMLFGNDRYAPAALPGGVRVVATGGEPEPIEETPLAKTRAVRIGHVAGTPRFDDPDPAWRAAADDAIWLRRTVYFATVVMLALLVFLPLLAPRLGLVSATLTEALAGQGALSAFFAALLGWFAGAIPSWATPWTTVLVDHPIETSLFLAAFVGLLIWSFGLRDSVADRVHRIWFTAPPPSEGASARIVGLLRREDGLPHAIYRWCAGYLLPGLAVAVLYGVIAVLTLRFGYESVAGSGVLCRDESRGVPQRLDDGSVRIPGFPAASPCWNTGVVVTKDHRYTLALEMDPARPFFDRTIPSGAGGYTDAPWALVFASPLRRWWRADWFQPIARIGRYGSDEWPLVAADGIGATSPRRTLTNDALSTGCKTPVILNAEDPMAFRPGPITVEPEVGGGPGGIFAPIPDGSLAAAEAHRRRCLPQTFVTTFTAPATGELHLYLDDVVLALPFLPPFTGFYRNNGGFADVTIREETTAAKPQ